MPSLFRTDLRLIKSVAILLMIVTHCRFFYSLYHDFGSELSESPGLWTKALTLTGLLALCIPLIAGQELYERLRPSLIGGRLRSFAPKPFLSALLLIALIDPLKSLVAEGMIYAFRWNALPMICVTMAVIVFLLPRLSARWMGLVAAGVLVLSAFVSPALSKFAILSPKEYEAFLSSPLRDFSLFLFLLGLGLWFERSGRLLVGGRRGFVRFVWMAVFVLVAAQIYRLWQVSPSFAVSIANLPLGSLIHLGPGGGHLWPLLPWSSLVLFGFWLQWLQYRLGESRRGHGFLLLACGLLLVFSFESFYRDYLGLLDAKAGYSSRIFSLSSPSFVSLFAIYVLVFYALKLLATPRVFMNPLIQLMSSGILVIYVVHYILAARLAPIVSRLLGGEKAYPVYLLLVFGLTIGLSGLMIFLYQSRIKITLRRLS